MDQYAGLAGELGGAQRGLEPFGLRPETGVGIVHGKIVEQRVDRHSVTDSGALADGNQPERRISQGTGLAARRAQQQPGPLELMPGFDEAPGDPRRGPPIGGEDFAERAGAGVNEAIRGELDQALRPDPPGGIAADLAPSQTGLQQMHVRIGFEELARVLVRVERAIGRR